MVVAPDAAAAYVEKRMESRSPHPIIFFRNCGATADELGIPKGCVDEHFI